MADDLHYLTIHEASKLIESRELSPVELTRAFLDRIEALDSTLNAYITVLPDAAMAQARDAEAEIERGGYRGPLHGIPIALKDLYDTAGVLTTASSRVFADRVPEEDSTATAQLKSAGAILLGKLAMHEFALTGPDPTCGFPIAKNPWNIEYHPGGSSSGSGTAIAAGLCMGTLGSCTGGSIRGPASHCSIVGLKPTYSRVSRYGVIPMSWTLDHVGPMTWNVEDTTIMLQAIAGYDPKDPTSSQESVPDYSEALVEDIQGLRVGVPRHFFFSDNPSINPETLVLAEEALKTLEGLGARIEEVTIPSLEHVGAAYMPIAMSEGFAYHERNLKERLGDYGEMVRDRFLAGGLFTSADYVQGQRVRSVVKREFAEALESVDVIASPTSARPSGKFAEVDLRQVARAPSFTNPYNMTGLPAISVPCGFNSEGMPVGFQIAGRPFDESIVLRAAYTYQQAVGLFQQRPPI